MIFTDAFIETLSTFNKINPAMFFREGTVQTTQGVNGGNALTFFTRAYTDVDIPSSFAIGDLGRLLGVLRMFDAPEVNIEGPNLIISGGNKQVSIMLSKPEYIVYQQNPDKIKITEGYEAVLTPTNINDILSLYSVFNAENISFVGRNGKFQVIVSSLSNPKATDQGVIDLGSTDEEFNAVIQAVNFRIEKNKKQVDYKLLVNRKGVVYIGNESLEYYIPTEAKFSKF